MNWAEVILENVLETLRALFTGPFAGAASAALTFLVLEIGVRKQRDRHALADALAGELTACAIAYRRYIKHAPTERIDVPMPQDFHTSDAVYRSVAHRLGEFPFDEIVTIIGTYGVLASVDDMVAVLRRQFERLETLPEGDARTTVLKVVREGMKDLERIVPDCEEVCKMTASVLRTRYSTGLVTILPQRAARAVADRRVQRTMAAWHRERQVDLAKPGGQLAKS